MKILSQVHIFADTPPTPACHASTIVQSGGRLIAAWFGGTKESADDVEIWCSYRQDGVWSAPQMVSVKSDIPCWNPVLYRMPDDTVWLFYKQGHEIPAWRTMVAVSRDGGETWSEPRELVPGDTSGGRGPVKNKPLLSADGVLLAGNSNETQKPWRCSVDRRENGVWRQVDIPAPDPSLGEVSLIQPSLWEYPAGCVHALMRSDFGRIFRSDSADGGRTWCPACPTDLPNNNSGLDCVMTENGTLVLVCNPVDKNWGKRSPLSVFTSVDNGATFQKQLDLETADGEFSYPSVIAEGDRVYVVYTHRRQSIVCCELSL